ncbi:MAG TPA: trypsin-like peptidase domain-containing protein [Gemmatimonadales bacterium]|jgi:S1-C subfamily serine protease
MLRLLSALVLLLAWKHAEAQQLRDLFRKVSPAVVVIRTLERELAEEPSRGLVNIPGLGSGVLISADGKVLTAAHVVQVAERVGIEFKDGKVYPAHVVGSSAQADVALVQLDRVPTAASPAPLADSDSLEVGDQVIVIGAPYGYGHSLTVGHVSGRLTIDGIVSGVPMEVIQTDAAINVGNSGGPMFNLDGEVVGIVSSILTQSGGFEGVGFAVPTNVARKVLLTGGSFWSGMDGILLQDTLAQIFNLPQKAGVLVQQVAAGSPAAALGLRAGTWRATIGEDQLLVGGDIILSVAGVEIKPKGATLEEMRIVLGKLRPGDSVTAKVLRGGKVVSLSAVKPMKQ